MSTTTTNLGLIKPELTDVADITAMNENWDKLDTELNDLKEKGGAVKSVNGKTGEVELTAEDVGALSDEGGTLTGNLKISRANSPTIEMEVSSDNGYTSVYQHGGTLTISSAMTSDSDDTFMEMSVPSGDDSDLLKIGRTISGSTKRYNVLHSGNITDYAATPDDHNWKSYNSLDQISDELTINSTPAQVATAMPDYSILTLATGNAYGEYTGGLVPSVENGFLIIRRATIARCTFEFVGEVNGLYYGWMRSNVGTWSGWQQVYTEKSPLYTYGTEDLTAGTSELETGKLYFCYE